MKRFVIDANVVIKWVFAEDDSNTAHRLKHQSSLIAPELLLCECANVIWKKVRRGEYTSAEGEMAARLIGEAGLLLFPAGRLFPRATQLAVQLDHAAYDCFYLALAEAEDCALVTTDIKLLNKCRTHAPDLNVLSLAEAAAL